METHIVVITWPHDRDPEVYGPFATFEAAEAWLVQVDPTDRFRVLPPEHQPVFTITRIAPATVTPEGRQASIYDPPEAHLHAITRQAVTL